MRVRFVAVGALAAAVITLAGGNAAQAKVPQGDGSMGDSIQFSFGAAHEFGSVSGNGSWINGRANFLNRIAACDKKAADRTPVDVQYVLTLQNVIDGSFKTVTSPVYSPASQFITPAGNKTMKVGPAEECRVLEEDWRVQSSEIYLQYSAAARIRTRGFSKSGTTEAAGPWHYTGWSKNPYVTGCPTCKQAR
ncbi:hypothetical protein HPO96_35985 [Kribbella sandramycini]|uniref:Uncharacterized protein n=1 Tax=Kribbella sandramycini TaxID=60450 RepID=A0A7Y4L9A9_9ACTN|nr:hypothetical protein [Kribbella sandramycini]MBB6568891.1 hypothetical protein [Kribbella sandramycini]NOL45657.1 hypothetical protein [Kribbella sandramycini]